MDEKNFLNYDFCDFGAGTGGSIEYCEKRFGGKGIGIELDPQKILEAKDRGVPIFQANILDFPRKKIFRYVSMMDFLEHLPNQQTVDLMIERACEMAKDFVFINHPVFDDEKYLKDLGFKLYFQDWKGHTVHPKIESILGALSRNGVQTIELQYRKRFDSSSHSSVLPMDAPTDSFWYDADVHGAKNNVAFNRILYEQVQIIGRFT